MAGNFHTAENESHVYHHYDNDGARINVAIEQNTRGFNFNATVTGAKTVAEAMALLKDAKQQLEGLVASSNVSKPVITRT